MQPNVDGRPNVFSDKNLKSLQVFEQSEQCRWAEREPTVQSAFNKSSQEHSPQSTAQSQYGCSLKHMQ